MWMIARFLSGWSANSIIRFRRTVGRYMVDADPYLNRFWWMRLILMGRCGFGLSRFWRSEFDQIWNSEMNFIWFTKLMGLAIFSDQIWKMRRREVMKAFGSNVKSVLPLAVVEIILDYAYSVQCGRSSVQYWFWLHEPKFQRQRTNEDNRRPTRSLARFGSAN